MSLESNSVRMNLVVFVEIKMRMKCGFVSNEHVMKFAFTFFSLCNFCSPNIMYVCMHCV